MNSPTSAEHLKDFDKLQSLDDFSWERRNKVQELEVRVLISILEQLEKANGK